MTTRIVDCFEVQLWDGGDRHNHECYVSNEKDAYTIAGQHGITLARTFIIHEHEEDFKHWESGKIREQALAKLSREEQIALGLAK